MIWGQGDEYRTVCRGKSAKIVARSPIYAFRTLMLVSGVRNMEVTLNSRITQWVEQQIASGQYESIDELFETALSLLAKRDQYDQWVQEVGEKIDVAIQQLDRGEGVDGEVAISQLRQRLAQRQD